MGNDNADNLPVPAASLAMERVINPDVVLGWSIDGLMAWIVETTKQVSGFEERTAQMRLNVGLAMWALREQVPETEYDAAVRQVADETGVALPTLKRWRRDAEKAMELPSPPKAKRRSDAQRERREKERSLISRDISGPPSAGTPPIDVQAKEAVPPLPDPVPSASPVSPQSAPTVRDAVTPAPAPVKPPRAHRPPAEPTIRATVGDAVRLLLRTVPGEAGLKRAVLDDLALWVRGALDAVSTGAAPTWVGLAPDVVDRLAVMPGEPFDAGVNRAIRDLAAEVDRLRKPVLAPNGKPSRPPPKRGQSPPVEGPCSHPVTRRLGTSCGACGATLKK